MGTHIFLILIGSAMLVGCGGEAQRQQEQSAALAAFAALAAARYERIRAEAEQGDAQAQIDLGYMYERGKDGVAEDDCEAAKWYRLASRQNHPSSFRYAIVERRTAYATVFNSAPPCPHTQEPCRIQDGCLK